MPGSASSPRSTPAWPVGSEVRSSDGTVTLPEIPDQALILRIGHLEGHQVDLGWFTGFPSEPMPEPLGTLPATRYEPAVLRGA